ncbi:hypothetical protein [Streptomyces albireticuli]|uniref:hypothetical protein n=1 Tax=Streptomyces albireticuli TaxID=1940 RepID=UPI00369274A8
MSNGDIMGPDAYRSGGRPNPPVRCVKCKGVTVITTHARNPRTESGEWRLTCLECRVAWPMDQHGGEPDEYI